MWWTLGFEPPTSRLIAHSFLFKFRGYGLKQGGWGASSKGDLTFITLNASYLNQIFMILIWGDDRQNVGGLPPEELRGLINRRWERLKCGLGARLAVRTCCASGRLGKRVSSTL